MAYTVTVVYTGPTLFVADIACLDADVTGDINHLLGAAPLEVYITPLVSLAAAADGFWSASVIDATKITVTKANSGGSGGGVPGTTKMARLVCRLPHTMSK